MRSGYQHNIEDVLSIENYIEEARRIKSEFCVFLVDGHIPFVTWDKHIEDLKEYCQEQSQPASEIESQCRENDPNQEISCCQVALEEIDSLKHLVKQQADELLVVKKQLGDLVYEFKKLDMPTFVQQKSINRFYKVGNLEDPNGKIWYADPRKLQSAIIDHGENRSTKVADL